MQYSMDQLITDCYKNNTVLKNKFDIRDEAQTDAIEYCITRDSITKATMEILLENVDFEFYKKLHKYVLGDIYDLFGNIRTVGSSKKGIKRYLV